MAIIRFSHPWRRDEFITTIHRTICQDSTAYFLSVLSIQTFVTVSVSSGAVVSLNVRFSASGAPTYLNRLCLVSSGCVSCHVSPVPRYGLELADKLCPLRARTNVYVCVHRAFWSIER